MVAFSILELNRLERFSKYSAFRRDRVILFKHLFQKIFFAIREFFFGVSEREAFAQFYSRMRGNIEQIRLSLQEQFPCDATFQQLKTLIKIGAKIEVSHWGLSLQRNSEAYALYRRQLLTLQEQGAMKAFEWAAKASESQWQGRYQTARWIKATLPQLHSAAKLNLPFVPYLYKEIPAGAVILTNPKMYMRNIYAKGGISFFFRLIIIKIKALVCWLLTGKQYTHASFSLGSGYLFDLDKNSPMACSGVGKILNKRDRICYHDIVLPNKEKMLQAYNNHFFRNPVKKFTDLWQQIELEVRGNASLVRGNFREVLKLAIPSQRTSQYDPTTDWRPGERNYLCSVSIGALLAKFGIDIGKEFNIINDKITPAHFQRSSFFIPTDLSFQRG